MAKNKYSAGRKAEQRVASRLRRAGASVRTSPGSRGPADLTAIFEHKKWLVQVKSGENPPKELPARERQRINQMARSRKATPVLARVTTKAVEYRSTRSNRKLKP
ncbi:MAG: hypothetical protein IBX71_09350 [Candidatus Desulforudis sp.]|nr:hypothetical protein [Desulforudis sp.]